MHLPTSPKSRPLLRLALLLALTGPILAAPPAITSAAHVALYYDVQNPGDVQFAYQIVATGAAVTFDASGLPPLATLDRATGWIVGTRNVPGVYDVAVRATNDGGTAAATVRLAIHPAAIGVRSSQGVFGPGQTFSITVNYNTAVLVTGTPRLALALGPAGTPVLKDAVYASGSGTHELVFQYHVAGGDNDPDGVQLLASAPSGGTITDAAGLTASPYLPVRHFVSGITIQGGPGVVTTSSVSAAPPASSAGQLTNVSARMRVGEGDAGGSLIAGFVVAGSQPKRLLLRAIGPALTGFGVQGALTDPRLQLYSSAGALVAENDNWAGAETSAGAAAVGAFALSAGTRDSAVMVTVQPGAYTLVVSPNGGAGVALAEVYDADGAAPGASAISNLSTRGQIDGDGSPLIAGFSVQGASARRVLIRGIGPGLTLFGVGGALGDPILKIYQDGRLVAENDNWAAALAENTSAAAESGAFALAADSRDAAIVLALEPGSYTAVVSGVGATSGAGLVEIYELPAKS